MQQQVADEAAVVPTAGAIDATAAASKSSDGNIAHACAVFASANQTRRNALITQWQQQHGNAFVQKVIASSQLGNWNQTRGEAMSQQAELKLFEMFDPAQVSAALQAGPDSAQYVEMIRAAQQSLGIAADGKYGRGTATALNAAHIAPAAQPVAVDASEPDAMVAAAMQWNAEHAVPLSAAARHNLFEVVGPAKAAAALKAGANSQAFATVVCAAQAAIGAAVDGKLGKQTVAHLARFVVVRDPDEEAQLQNAPWTPLAQHAAADAGPAQAGVVANVAPAVDKQSAFAPAIAWNTAKAEPLGAEAQQKLSELFDPCSVTAAFAEGSASESFAAMIAAAQRVVGLTVDGKCGKGTAARLANATFAPLPAAETEAANAAGGWTPRASYVGGGGKRSVSLAGLDGTLARVGPDTKWLEEDNQFQATAYNDDPGSTSGHMTIGYGFDLQQSNAPEVLRRIGAPGTAEEYISGKRKFTQALADKAFDVELREKIIPHALQAGASGHGFSEAQFREQSEAVQALLLDMSFHRGGGWFGNEKPESGSPTEKFLEDRDLSRKGGKEVGDFIKAKDYAGAARAMMASDYSVRYGRRYVHAVATLEAFGKGHFDINTAEVWIHDYEQGDASGVPTFAAVAGMSNADFPITAEAKKKYIGK